MFVLDVGRRLIIALRNPLIQNHGELPNPLPVRKDYISVIVGFDGGNFTDLDIVVDRLQDNGRVGSATLLLFHTHQSTFALNVYPFQIIFIPGIVIILKVLCGDKFNFFALVKNRHCLRSLWDKSHLLLQKYQDGLQASDILTYSFWYAGRILTIDESHDLPAILAPRLHTRNFPEHTFNLSYNLS